MEDNKKMTEKLLILQQRYWADIQNAPTANDVEVIYKDYLDTSDFYRGLGADVTPYDKKIRDFYAGFMEGWSQTLPSTDNLTYKGYTFDNLFARLEELHYKHRAWQRLVEGETLDKEKLRKMPLKELYIIWQNLLKEYGKNDK